MAPIITSPTTTQSPPLPTLPLSSHMLKEEKTNILVLSAGDLRPREPPAAPKGTKGHHRGTTPRLQPLACSQALTLLPRK